VGCTGAGVGCKGALIRGSLRAISFSFFSNLGVVLSPAAAKLGTNLLLGC